MQIDDLKVEELNNIHFTILGKPFGKQRPRVVHRGNFSKAYTPKETVMYESWVKIAYLEKAKDKMFKDGDMLEVHIIAYFDIPSSVSKKKREMMLTGRIRPTKKPDFDNIGKIVCDSLNKVAYYDDSCIVSAKVDKFYSERPRVEVWISKVKGE